MHCYIAGARAGDGDLMRPAFHPSATISGYCQGVEYSGSIEHVFQWTTENGPAPNINPRFARIEIIALFIWKFNTGQASWLALMPELPTYLPCSNVMASGRSRINVSTGTTNNSLYRKSGSDCREQEPRLRGQHTRRRNQKEFVHALLRSASGELWPVLGKDLSWKSPPFSLPKSCNTQVFLSQTVVSHRRKR
jgi:hypothetical protein